VIDFFHQRKHQNGGFNTNNDSAYNYFQQQYQPLAQDELLKKVQVEPTQYTENPSTKNSLKALAGKLPQNAGGGRNAANGIVQVEHDFSNKQVRPQSRHHKDPSLNLGLEQFPERVTKQQDLKELKGGFFSLDIGDTFVQLDIDGFDGFEGLS
jgi:hypothetical protein